MIMTNDTFIEARHSLTQSSDILNRIYKSIEIIQDKGYEVTSVGCSSKLFMEISKRFAPRLGFLPRDKFILKQQKKPTDVSKQIPLLRDKKLIYSENKQFYLKVIDPINQQNGMVFPTFT